MPSKTSQEILDKIDELGQQGLSSTEMSPIIGKSAKAIQKLMLKWNLKRIGRGARDGERNYFWNGGCTIDKNGYRLVYRPDHPFAVGGRYVREHRLVMECHLQRYLLPTEVVHHKDGNRANNAIENLELFASNAEHLKIELTGRVPKWSEDGRRRTLEGVRRPRVKKVASIQ